MPDLLSLQAIQDTLRRVFPVSTDRVALEFIDAAEAEEGGLRAVFQYWIYDPSKPGACVLSDAREQDLFLIPKEFRDEPARVLAFLEGWALALDALLPLIADPATLLPSDLFDRRVLQLARANTAEDFRKALLVRSRLGRHLPA